MGDDKLSYSIWRGKKYIKVQRLTEKEAEQLKSEGYKLYRIHDPLTGDC